MKYLSLEEKARLRWNIGNKNVEHSAKEKFLCPQGLIKVMNQLTNINFTTK